VRANTASDSSGNATINIAPYPIFSDAFQNVTSASNNIPTATPLVFLTGTSANTYAQNLLLHKDAFTLATADLIDVAKFGAWGARSNYKGISLRMAKQYR